MSVRSRFLNRVVRDCLVCVTEQVAVFGKTAPHLIGSASSNRKVYVIASSALL